MAAALSLHICFRTHGFRWPLHDDDTVQVWTNGHALVTTLPGRVLRHLVEVHLAHVAIQEEIDVSLRRPPVKVAARAELPFPAATRARFRDRRQSRRRK